MTRVVLEGAPFVEIAKNARVEKVDLVVMGSYGGRSRSVDKIFFGSTAEKVVRTAGCQVLTVLGDTFAGRVGASLLHAVGLPELVSDSTQRYVETGIALAQNRAELARLRSHLEGPGRASVLFDTARTTRALEAADAAMAEQYRSGARRSFLVKLPPAGS